MIDSKLLRLNFASLKERVLSKDPSYPVDLLKELHDNYSKSNFYLEGLLYKLNSLSDQVKKFGMTMDLKEETLSLKKEIERSKIITDGLYLRFNDLILRCPNIPDDSLPIGDKSNNVVIKEFGKKPAKSIMLNHVGLLEKDNSNIFEKGSCVSGSGFLFYDSYLTKLIYDLCAIFITHNESYGFTPILPPYLLSKKVLTNSGNFPKFVDDVYKVESEDLYLLPTAEVAISSYHANSILKKEILPLRYCSWTDCFRREAGGYGAQERGLIRIHQFHKVEIFSFCLPEKSKEEHEYMLDCAESLLKKFDIHYRVSLLATQDSSFSASKTYDIEVWLPGQKEYKEVSSVSLCTDFQARRGNIRYKDSSLNKNRFVHMLNASSLAVPRLMVALLETYQNDKGRIDYGKISNLISNIKSKY
jgi:seryl-tRNA synthetase